MLLKLQIDELLGKNTLPYDILDATGKVLFNAGESTKQKALTRQAEQGLYRVKEVLPLERVIQSELPTFFEHHPQAELETILNDAVAKQQTQELNIDYLLDRETAAPYLTSMFTFWRNLQSGMALDTALLDVMYEHLIADIICKMGELRYLNQLRIRDGVTYSHTLDVTAVSIALGLKLGLDDTDLHMLALGAMLHDVGKLFIPKPIMFKSSRLSDAEFDVMKLHPEIGYRILKNELKLPDEVARPALEHQEQYAGGGYPQNLVTDQIHYFSQIVKIADVYDALTSKRPYKEAIPSTKAIQIMLMEGSRAFNPTMLRAFLELANYPEPISESL